RQMSLRVPSKQTFGVGGAQHRPGSVLIPSLRAYLVSQSCRAAWNRIKIRRYVDFFDAGVRQQDLGRKVKPLFELRPFCTRSITAPDIAALEPSRRSLLVIAYRR